MARMEDTCSLKKRGETVGLRGLTMSEIVRGSTRHSLYSKRPRIKRWRHASFLTVSYCQQLIFSYILFSMDLILGIMKSLFLNTAITADKSPSDTIIRASEPKPNPPGIDQLQDARATRGQSSNPRQESRLFFGFQ